MVVHAGDEKLDVRTQLIGRQMVFPVLAAIAVARERNCDLHQTAARLARQEPKPGRMHLERLDNGAVLICDYHKSAYETVLAALDALSEVPAERRIVVLGEVAEPPGSQGPIYREIGARVAQVASRAVFVGHSVQPYKTGAKRAGMPVNAITTVGDDPVAAAEAILDDLGPGDVVLIKGRDTQKMERTCLALQGRSVGCRIPICRLRGAACADCPLLDGG
jgi:UDP-N-acetylmuramyl pentapeptide synthase